ncbi:MAG: hypothetical protein WD294_14635 [Phycisphaeraceae bacterium]
MSAQAKQHEVVIWAEASSVELTRTLMGRMSEMHATAVGGHRRTGLADLAEAVDAPVVDDLRRILIERPPAYLLLASATGVTVDELRQARQAGTTVLALEPTLGSEQTHDDIANDPHSPPPPILGWWWRQSPAWLAAADPQQAVGSVRGANVVTLAPAYTASLLARLIDAFDMLVALMGVPESIDASLSGVLSEPPEELRGLTGHLTAHLRFADGASASLLASDRAANWQRRLTALGSEAQLELGDIAYRLHERDGKLIDSLEHLDQPLDAVDLLVQQWRRIISGGVIPRHQDQRTLIACCQAALLSCRTGQLESPNTLLRLGG